MSDDPFVTQLGTLRTEGASPAPDVWDIVICGGGPSGTTAAMRAKELGLQALVLDYDDVMKRIRDYPKSKPILPTYGGGDKATFPGGDKLVQSLYFDDIDKDDLVAKWKECYRDAGLSARIGSELTGLEPQGDGTYEVVTWNHRGGEEIRYRTRNVVVAVGAGVPRRFDIPGDTDGIAFRLDDPANYVNKGPILVIGGGTSAAEAVIAISAAKMDAEDECHVYWGYRGTKMPKISKALADRFFDAYLGNGNVRYLRMSDPALVIRGPDKRDYLSLLVDRKQIEGRPAESTHYEFPKECVIACIGTDLPVKLLQKIGIKVPLVNNQPRMLVSEDGETNLPGVFLVGDARGPRFLRCSDHEDTETYEKVNMKRNIKAAMNDAAQVAEVIARRAGVDVPEVSAGPVRGPRLEGGTPVGTEDGAAPEQVAPVASPAEAPAEEVKPPTGTHPGEQPSDATAPVVMTLHPDGEPEEEFPIHGDRVEIGRKASGIACPEEAYMADHHATLERAGDGFAITDTGQGSGVWLRVLGSDGSPVQDGDQLWLGSQVLVASHGADGWLLTHYDREGTQRETYAVTGKGLFVGRGSELNLDPADMAMSRRHAQFVPDGDGLQVYDRGAVNGTYVRVRGTAALHSGSEFRLATKRFRLENVAAVEKLEADAVVIDAPPEEALAPAAREAAAPAAEEKAAATTGEGAAVNFQSDDYPTDWVVGEGTTVLKAYQDGGGVQDEPLGWECQKGVCGLCAVQILEGADQFEPVDEASSEMKTIQIAVGVEPDPTQYRLACISRIKGPVKLCIPE